MFTRDEAAKIFLKQLITEAYEGVVTGMQEHLNEVYRGPIDDLKIMTDWFQGLSETDKQQVYKVVQWTAHDVVMSLCTLLDGVSGHSSPPLEQKADFALYLQVYPDFESLLKGSPVEFSVRINPDAGSPELHGPELHDLFHEMIGYVSEAPGQYPKGLPDIPLSNE